LEPFIFHEGPLTSGYLCSFETAIFNRCEHLTLQSKDGWVSFYILHPESKTAWAHIHFHLKNNEAHSPYRSPFGSFEFSEMLEHSILFQFIAFAEERLKALNVSRIVIKNPPQSYSEQSITILNTFLLNQGFRVMNAELSSILQVNGQGFENHLHVRKKRKLLQSKKNPFRFEVAGIKDFDRLYKFIEELRREKKFKLSISLEALRETVKIFEKEFLLFALYHNDNLAGASVGIKVNSRVMYHFISDYTRRIGNSAPGLLLIEGIYNYCAQQKISILDLGTSALGGKPNFKLFAFKTELGAVPSAKFTFAKEIS
jgi:hypothetical protein